MTVEERALEYQGKLASSFAGFPELLEGAYSGYIVGAAEQKAIDIKKACKWLEEELHKLAMEDIDENFLNNEFKVLMKSDIPKWINGLCEAMKK